MEGMKQEGTGPAAGDWPARRVGVCPLAYQDCAGASCAWWLEFQAADPERPGPGPTGVCAAKAMALALVELARPMGVSRESSENLAKAQDRSCAVEGE